MNTRHIIEVNIESGKAGHVMPASLLQKPSKSPKAREHLKALETHMKLWDEDSIDDLLYGSQIIQVRLRSD